MKKTTHRAEPKFQATLLHGISYIVFGIMAVAVVLGITLRLVETFSGNYVFGFDQGLDFLAARSIAVDHKITLIGSEAGAGFAGLPGVFHGPGYRYILAVLLAVPSGNPYGAIVFLGALSVVLLWVLFRLSDHIFGRPVAWATVFLAAVSLPLIGQGRMVWAPNFSGLVALPFLFTLWMSRKNAPWYMFLTALLASSLYHFEIPMAVPAVLASFLYFLFVTKNRQVYGWGLYVFGIFLGFLPMLLFEARHGWGLVKGLLSYGGRIGATKAAAPFYPLKELIGDGNALLSTIRDSFHFGVPWVSGIFPAVLLAGALIFAYREKSKDIRQFVTALLLLIGSHVLVYYPYRGPVYSHYLSLLYFVYPLVAAYVAVASLSIRATRLVVYVLGLLMIIEVLSVFPKTIRYDYADYGGTAKMKGKIDAIDAIYEHAAGKGFNIQVFTPPVLPHAYDYILLWYAAKKYGYTPERNLTGTVYLLIEPDPEKPWSYNGWLETVIKTGEVESRWKLPSGFMIEKRFMKGI